MTFKTKSLTALALITGVTAGAATAQQATFAMVDADADGYLTETELTTAFGEVGTTLLQFDADADGKLTPAEVQASNEARLSGGATAETDAGNTSVEDIVERSNLSGDVNDDKDDLGDVGLADENSDDGFGSSGDEDADDPETDDQDESVGAAAEVEVEANVEAEANQ